VRVVGAHPAASGHAKISFETGVVHRLSHPPETIADGTRTLAIAANPFSLIRELVDDIRLVPEDAIVDAMRIVWDEADTVVEPTGALSLALALADRSGSARAVCVLSGGNIDPAHARAFLGLDVGRRRSDQPGELPEMVEAR
jgi:threonine dehydratase